VDHEYFRKRGRAGFLEAANKDFKPIHPQEELKIAAVVRAVIRKYHDMEPLTCTHSPVPLCTSTAMRFLPRAAVTSPQKGRAVVTGKERALLHL